MNRVMAAVDPVLVDAYVCDLMGYTVDEARYVRLAQELGVGSADIGRIKVCALNEGEEVKAPDTRRILKLQDAVEEVDSCSACYGYLMPALDRLREEGLLEKLRDKISIGQGFRNQSGKLGVGNCTRGFKYSQKGCPPTEGEIYEFLKNYIMKN